MRLKFIFYFITIIYNGLIDVSGTSIAVTPPPVPTGKILPKPIIVNPLIVTPK